jgi:hypothetical protein
VLVNLYCTHRAPPPLGFRHALHQRRDRSDPELLNHLHGFAGYVAKQGGPMTAPRFNLIQHILRVQHHLSLEIGPAEHAAMTAWARAANAVVFLPDGSVCDPELRVLVGRDGAADATAVLPYLPDAIARKAATERLLAGRGVRVLPTLPPSVGGPEVALREPREVVQRALALLVVAVRAETINEGDPWPIAELREKFPLAFPGLSPVEAAFMASDRPERQAVVNHAWRYEALALLVWALGRVDTLPFPDAICDVRGTVGAATAIEPAAWLARATLRPAGEILDALDQTYRLHWAVRQATQVERRPVPAGIEPGVVAERHHALNWLVRRDDADWDDVETPT